MNSLRIAIATLFCCIVFCEAQSCSWGTWGEWSTCSDNCGNCGTQHRARTCSATSSSCSCSGDSTQQQMCSPAICKFPRTSCCSGSPASVNGKFECA